MLPTTLLHLVSSALSWINLEFWIAEDARITESPTLRFELRQTHALSPSARIVWSDAPQAAVTNSFGGHSSPERFYSARTRTLKTSRPVSHEAFLRARSLSRFTRQSAKLDWEEDEVVAPDVESRQTLLELAKMTNNAYLEPGEAGWYDLGGKWNVVRPRTPL